MLSRIALTRNGGHVKRWHTKQIIGEQTVGHHSFGVVSLLLILHPNPSLDLLRAAMWHDMAEQVTGDVPSPILRSEHEFGTCHDKIEAEFMRNKLFVRMDHLPFNDHSWLWACDKLECLLFCREQVALGNKGFENICGLLTEWFLKTDAVPGPVMAIVYKLSQSYCGYSLEDVLEVMGTST